MATVGPCGERAVVAAVGAERDVHVHAERRRRAHGRPRSGRDPCRNPATSPPRLPDGEDPAQMRRVAATTAAVSTRRTVSPSDTRSSASASSAGVHPPSGPTATVRSPGASGRPPGSAATADTRTSAAGAGPLISGSHTRRDCSAASTAMRRSRSSWRSAALVVPADDRALGLHEHQPVDADLRALLHQPVEAIALRRGDGDRDRRRRSCDRHRRRRTARPTRRPQHTAATGRRRRSRSRSRRRAAAARCGCGARDASSSTGAPTSATMTWAADRRRVSSTRGLRERRLDAREQALVRQG